METKNFPSNILGHLDFTADQSPLDISLPNELPKRNDYSHLPADLLKTTTIENLISQNEDLMARLKVSLRRLSILEIENKNMNEEMNRVRLTHSSFTDQLLILKEKDSIWKSKVDQAEKDREIQTERATAMENRLRGALSELARHIKYHDRIKTQVKPYISQLKEYSKTQELKVKELEGSQAQREAQLRDLRNQMLEVAKNSRYQVESSERKSIEMVGFYEEQLESLKRENAALKQSQNELEIKTVKLSAALERQDALENEVITLRRTKEEMKERLERELENQKNRMQDIIRQNQKLGVEHADLQVRVIEDAEQLQKLEKENFQLREQLESLRYMWNAKNEENEKMKLAAGALERLNIELSQKLSELRKSEAL
jgi:chromosome segregation ATPase